MKNKILKISLFIFAAICFFNFTGMVKADTCRVKFHSDVKDISRTMPCNARIGDYGSLPTVEKTGFKFNGWFTKESGGTKVTLSTVITSNPTTFYAQWTENRYILYLKSQGGSPSTREIELRYSQSFNLGNFQPTKAGYLLKGWATNESATSPTYGNTQAVSKLTPTDGKRITLYAVWQDINYTLVLNPNGGTGNTINKVLKYSDKYTLSYSPNRTGYTLLGWNQSRAATTAAYKMGQQVTKLTTTNNDHVTLYAIWKANVYNIKFNANGGTGSMGTISGLSYDKTYPLIANKFTREDYVFKGWNLKADGSGKSFTDKQVISNLTPNPNATVVLYAQWEKAEQFKITYDLDGGGTEKLNRVSYSSTSNTFTLENPTKEGYEFIGWTGSNGETPQTTVTIAKGSTGDKNYKANYKANTYEIEFLDADGGAKKLELEYGSELTDVPKSSKKGYTFVAWVDEEGNILGDTVQVGNKKYSPAFRANKYKVKFDSNGGKGSMKDQQFTYDKKDQLNKNEYENAKYTFKGWNTKADGTGTSYSDGSEILNLTDKDNEGIVLYATWDAAPAAKEIKNPKTGAYISTAIISLLILVGASSYIISKKKTNIKKI